MNIIYKGLMTVALVGGAAMAAQAYNIELLLNNPNWVNVTLDDQPLNLDGMTLNEDGKYTLTIENPSKYPEMIVTPKPGYYIENFSSFGIGNNINQKMRSYAKQQFEETAYRNYMDVTAADFAATGNPAVTLNVDNAANLANMTLDYSNYYYEQFELPAIKNGENVISYIKTLDGKTYSPSITLASADGKPLYKVLVNGEEISPNYGTYNINLADGMQIDVKTVFPDENARVSFDLLQDGKGAVKSVSVNGEAVADWANGFDAKLGSEIRMEFDASLYKLNSVKWNDTSLNIETWNPSTTQYLAGATTVTIDATKYATYKVNVNVTDAEAVNLTSGGWPRTEYALVNGNNTIEVPENSNQLNLEATSDEYDINSVTFNGQTINPNYGRYYITIDKDGDLVIDAGVKVFDQKFVLYLDANPWTIGVNFFTMPGYTYFSPVSGNIEVGYNFYEATKSQLTGQAGANLNMYANAAVDPHFYVNGVEYQSTGSRNDEFRFTFGASTVPLQNGTVIKMYTNGVPETCNVSFDVEEGAEFTARHDFVANLETSSAFSCFAGTAIEIVSPRELIVTVNDVTIAKQGEIAEEEGIATLAEDSEENVYLFYVSGNDKVSISKNPNDGVNTINSDAAETVIYNLQGVRVNGTNLPAGIYIINGKKVMVK